MTKRIGDVVVIEDENPQQCEHCGRIAELRPYGRNGAAICFDCAMKPENKAETERHFGTLLGDG